MHETAVTDTGTIAGRCEWIGLGVLALACMLATMDLTILFLALPSISADLAPSATQELWITDVYGFMIAGSLITAMFTDERQRTVAIGVWGASFAAGAAVGPLSAGRSSSSSGGARRSSSPCR